MAHEMMILVLQLGLIVLFARISGWFFFRVLKQPQVLGELVAGMIIGPFLLGSINIPALHGPLFPLSGGTVPVSPELYGFAVLGSIVLLFTSGLETDLPTFIKFSGKGSVVGLGGIVVSFFLGSGITVLLNPAVDSLMHPSALFLGIISTATSVGITARILSEKRKLSSPEGVTILAAAVLDDVLSIVLLSIVVGLTVAVAGSGISWDQIGMVAIKAIGFWLVCTVLGVLIAPLFTRKLKLLGSLDLIAGISFGIALILAGISEMFELAMIIGAYIAGLSFSRTDVAHEIRERIQGVYNFLVPVFFCVMGMMVNFAAMKQVIWFGLAFAVVGFIGKLVGCGLPALLVGFNFRGALRIGAGMLPRGEVTLIIAGVGLSSGAIGQDMFGVAIMTMLFASIAAPPLLIKSFTGGNGYRKSLEKDDKGAVSIELAFPGYRAAEFMRRSLAEGFRQEGFYVHRLDHNRLVYQLRQNDIVFTLIQEQEKLILNTAPEHEPFIRLMMMEKLLEFKDFLSGLESMKSPDMMGAELMKGIFSQENE
ncbi:MAG: cation:proton antiporter [Spirochaetales bacterium]|nr:cation:proton antiporter [Spirochaetales bacterium]